MQSIIDYVLTTAGFPDIAKGLHPMASVFITFGALLVPYLLVHSGRAFITKRRFPIKGKHCYITGGSKGLGKSLAIMLSQQGAHVTIVARNPTVLEEAAAEIKAAAVDKAQKINFVAADVTDPQQASRALEKAQKLTAMTPEYVFTCAGTLKCFGNGFKAGQSLPGNFLDQDIKEFRQGMDLNYFGTLYTVKAAAKMMVENQVQGKITMIASVLGLFGLIGYSQYTPTKYALRGLAEVLHQELQVYGIGVHIMFPATIFTPGFEEEQKRKPEITKLIEGADEGQTPEAIARALLDGVKKGNLFITSDIIGDLARCVGKGIAPVNFLLADALFCAIGWIAFPLWRFYVNYLIRSTHKQKKN